MCQRQKRPARDLGFLSYFALSGQVSQGYCCAILDGFIRFACYFYFFCSGHIILITVYAKIRICWASCSFPLSPLPMDGDTLPDGSVPLRSTPSLPLYPASFAAQITCLQRAPPSNVAEGGTPPGGYPIHLSRHARPDRASTTASPCRGNWLNGR